MFGDGGGWGLVGAEACGKEERRLWKWRITQSAGHMGQRKLTRRCDREGRSEDEHGVGVRMGVEKTGEVMSAAVERKEDG